MIGFRMPTRVHIEPGAFGRLPEAARRLGLQSALLVVDPGIRDHTTWLQLACENLESTGFRVNIFDRVEPNPRTSTGSSPWAAEASSTPPKPLPCWQPTANGLNNTKAGIAIRRGLSPSSPSPPPAALDPRSLGFRCSPTNPPDRKSASKAKPCSPTKHWSTPIC